MKIALIVFSLIFLNNQLFSQSTDLKKLSIDECIKIGVENNKQYKISLQEKDKSESILNQAKSARLPQVDLEVRAFINDEDLTFSQPAMMIEFPAIELPGMALDLGQIEIPENKLVLAKTKTLSTSASVSLPLYTGGKISALIDQAQTNVNITNNKLKLTEREIIFNIKNSFSLLLLTNNLVQIGNDALDRLQIVSELTERLYNSGSENVTKLDYLKNKMALNLIKGIVAKIESNNLTCISQLKFYMGVPQSEEIIIDNVPPNFDYEVLKESLANSMVINNNLEVKILENVNQLYNFKIDEATSEYFPNIALFGSYNRWDNELNSGLFTEENKNMFTAGIGLRWNLFNGFRTSNSVDEAKTSLAQSQMQKNLLLDGLALQKIKLVNDFDECTKQIEAAEEALTAAVENRELNLKAYQTGFSELGDYIESQFYETFLSIEHQKTLYNMYKVIFEAEELFGNIH